MKHPVSLKSVQKSSLGRLHEDKKGESVEVEAAAHPPSLGMRAVLVGH